MLLEEKIDKRSNCFNFLRLIAALQVFVGHAIPSFEIGVSGILLFLTKILNIFEGVPLFFVLSGFLIWNSIGHTNTLKEFVKKRVARLYPELILGVLLNLIIMLMFNPGLMNSISFWIFQFTQSTIFQFWTPDILREYGTGTPNGPLWTITVFVQCYFVLWFVFKKIHLNEKPKKVWISIIVILILLSVSRPIMKPFLPSIIYKLTWYTFPTHLWLFIFGAFIQNYFNDIVPICKKYWIIALILSTFFNYTGLDFGNYHVLKSIFLGIGVIGFAYQFSNIKVKNDYSYSIYIYHMIVINVMVQMGYMSSPWLIPISFSLTFIVALASYHTVGSISRSMRKRVNTY